MKIEIVKSTFNLLKPISVKVNGVEVYKESDFSLEDAKLGAGLNATVVGKITNFKVIELKN